MSIEEYEALRDRIRSLEHHCAQLHTWISEHEMPEPPGVGFEDDLILLLD